MKPIRKRTVLLLIFAVFLAVLLLALGLFWPVIRSAASVKRLDDGLYSMEYKGDYGLEDFLDQGGKSSDIAVADYEILTEILANHPAMSPDEVRDAMNSVSKHNFDSVFASTEWSIVFDQTNRTASYYHREDFGKSWQFEIGT